MKSLLNWLDHRTGYRDYVKDALYERIPGGARWRYVWGSTLTFTFMVQMITGIFLWMAYSPSAQTAWESVYYIQYEMQYGWLLRGIHHFTAQMMIVLLALHFMQIVIDGAYKAPREVNFWLGLILMQIVLGLSLTGYLLPWDQKGYWATKVATSLSSMVPVIGPQIQRLVVGGPTYGHHTLTRFFALHAGVLPALLIAFLGVHIYVFRRHGITVPDPDRAPETTFWPDQVLKDAVACLGVLLVVLVLIFWKAPGHEESLSTLSAEGRMGEVLGADLGAPADPTENYSAARPEWYFLFLFQFLKYFHGETEVFGAIYIPVAVMGFMFLMPFIGRWKLGHRFNLLYISALLVGAVILTFVAYREDQNNPAYAVAVKDAHAKAERIHELIQGRQGVGVNGAVALLRNDPKTYGPAVFAKNCSQCHRYDGHDGTGKVLEEQATASDLGQFGTREWIRGFITNPAGPDHFGPTVRANFNGEPVETRFTEGDMALWSEENAPSMEQRDIDGVVEFLIAQGGRTDIPPLKEELVAHGREFFENSNDVVQACVDCHAIKPRGEEEELGDVGLAPRLTGYASEEWLRDFLLNPGAEHHYGERNAMPSYEGRMSDQDLEILLRWMRHRWYEPTGDVPVDPSGSADVSTSDSGAAEE